MINIFTAICFAIFGLIIIIWQFIRETNLPEEPSYSIPLGVFFSVILILIALGLYFKKSLARTAAMGMLLIGITSFVTVPIWLFLNFSDNAETYRVSTLEGIRIGLITQVPQLTVFLNNLIVALFSAVLFLGTLSYLSLIAYRYYRKAEVIKQYNMGSNKSLQAFLNLKTLASSLVLGALLIVSGKIMYIPQASLPAFLRTGSETQAKSGQIGDDASNFVRQLHFAENGKTLIIASKYNDLFLVDIGSGHITSKEKTIYSMSGEFTTKSDRLSHRLTANHHFFFSREGEVIELATDRRRKLKVFNTKTFIPLGLIGRVGALGYRKGADRLLALDTAKNSLVVLDVLNDRILYETRATKDAWLAERDNKKTLSEQLRNGVFSPDRSLYAYLFNRRLHTLNIETGKNKIIELTTDMDSDLIFSNDGNWLMVYAQGSRLDREPGIIYNLKTKETKDHSFGGKVHYWSTKGNQVILSEGTSLSKRKMRNGDVLWQTEMPGISDWVVTGEGGKLWVLNRKDARLEYADISKIQANQRPEFKTYALRLSPVHGRLVIASQSDTITYIESPKIELISPKRTRENNQKSIVLDLSGNHFKSQ